MLPKILFLCTGNSCRSQMAEGWARHLFPDHYQACSAGTDLHPLNQFAVKVMAESGVDISSHFPKLLQSFDGQALALIVTVCSNAAESCPVPPQGTAICHAPFEDPPRLAANAATEEEALQHYRRVRDQIKEFVLTLPSILS